MARLMSTSWQISGTGRCVRVFASSLMDLFKRSVQFHPLRDAR